MIVDAELLKCLLWQHDNAERLKSLLQQKEAWYRANHGDFWRDWTRDVFDLTTANAFGLAVWARILGVRLDAVVGPAAGDRWGFTVNHRNFERAGFGALSSGIASLDIEQQRLILRARYLRLISRGTIPEINQILALLVGDRGPAWAVDHHNMTTTVFFQFPEDSALSMILESFNLIPVPTAVQVNYVFMPREGFGFTEAHRNFNNGSFAE